MFQILETYELPIFFLSDYQSYFILSWSRILANIKDVLPLTWSPEAELCLEHVTVGALYPKPKHFESSVCEHSLSHIYLMKEFRRTHRRQSLSSNSMSRPWENTLVCSKSLSLNKNNALILGDGGSQHSWLVLSFGFKVNLYISLHVELHTSHCKYSHWDQ